MKKLICLFISCLFITYTYTQIPKNTEPSKPKLVVGIVVDQMAYEFLYKYADLYGDGGFKRLVNEGFSCEETHYNYIPTYTGPGHSSIYTGSVPAIHGIVSNDWYDRGTKSYIYCASDNTVTGVGTSATSILPGLMSPKNLLSTTICDQLKLSDNQQSKVIGIALKDRGAILTAGHTANAAYWYDGYSNAWITSSYYMSDLPSWVKNFNADSNAIKYLKPGWNLSLPKNKYVNATADSVNWEGDYYGIAAKPFPHLFTNLSQTESIKGTPFGNSFTADFAKAAIKNENLGKGIYTDFIAISFSSTDYVGHNYGPNSLEIEDTYIRFDNDIASLLNYLDAQIGKGNYLVFLTADHGVAPAVGYAQSLHIPSGVALSNILALQMDSIIGMQWGKGNWIESYSNQQIYLNDSLLQAERKTKDEAYSLIKNYLLTVPGVSNVCLINDQSDASIPDIFKAMLNNSIYPKRSGDIQVLFDPYWLEDRTKGTTHGTHYAYDTHVPLVFYGWHITHGKTYADIKITDIAPTIAAMLHISEPNGCIGKVIEDVMK